MEEKSRVRVRIFFSRMSSVSVSGWVDASVLGVGSV